LRTRGLWMDVPDSRNHQRLVGLDAWVAAYAVSLQRPITFRTPA
jgi:hypothetical protein